MAKNLFRLYHYFDKEEYYERSKNMSLSVTQEFEAYPSGYSNWFDLIYNLKSNYYEVAVVGDCLLYTSPSPRDSCASRMPSSA